MTRMWTESEGLEARMSFPRSTMAIRWPMGGVGYRTIDSMFYVCVAELQCKFQIHHGLVCTFLYTYIRKMLRTLPAIKKRWST